MKNISSHYHVQTHASSSINFTSKCVTVILTVMTLILDFLPHILSMAIGCHDICTNFGVDSSNRLSFTARTHSLTQYVAPFLLLREYRPIRLRALR